VCVIDFRCQLTKFKKLKTFNRCLIVELLKNQTNDKFQGKLKRTIFTFFTETRKQMKIERFIFDWEIIVEWYFL
jgi:hypothetical protein